MNSPEEWSPDEQRLHDALHRTADQVTPGPDGLAEIRRRIARPAWWRSPVVVGLAAAAAVAVAVIVGSIAVFGGEDPVVSTTPPPSSASSSERPQQTATAQPTIPAPLPSGPAEPTGDASTTSLTVPVYYVAAPDDGERLVREFHAVETALPPVEAALEQMLAQPAVDPNYGSLWPSGVGIASADVAGGTINVDLTAAPSLKDPSAERAEIATQQLVYTASAAAASLLPDVDGALPVQITVGGQPVTDLFGEVDVSNPVTRADPLDVRQLVQINDPTEGQSTTSPVTVSGEAAVFEATVTWEVRRVGDAGDVVSEDFATAEECCTFSPFSFEVELPPGTYEIVVSETDPSDGEGRSPFSDSRTFTVN